MWNCKDAPDSEWFRVNQKYGICSHCELSKTCSKSEQMPIISPMVSYVMKYNNEIQSGFAYYPNAGGWEQQPIWFTQLLASLRQAIAQQERKELEKHGNSR